VIVLKISNFSKNDLGDFLCCIYIWILQQKSRQKSPKYFIAKNVIINALRVVIGQNTFPHENIQIQQKYNQKNRQTIYALVEKHIAIVVHCTIIKKNAHS